MGADWTGLAGRAAAGRTALLRPGPGPAPAAIPVGVVTAGLGGVRDAVAAGGVEAGLMPGAAGPDRAGGRTAAGGRGPTGGLGITPAMKSDTALHHEIWKFYQSTGKACSKVLQHLKVP